MKNPKTPKKTVKNCQIPPKTIKNVVIMFEEFLKNQSTDYISEMYDKKNITTPFKLSVCLEKRMPNKAGECAVKIRFYFNRKTCYVPTGIYVLPENFSEKKVTSADKLHRLKNQTIKNKEEYVYNSLLELRSNNGLSEFDHITLSHFLKTGEKLPVPEERKYKKLRVTLNVSTYANKYCEKFQNKSSERSIMSAVAKMEKFADTKTLSLIDITPAWLLDFKSYCLKTGMSENGVAVYFRNIRTLYNDAITRELLDQNTYPFRRLKIKRLPTKHRNIEIIQFRSLLNYDFSNFPKEEKKRGYGDVQWEQQKQAAIKYRDIFLLSFYLCGLNMKDLLFLKPCDVQNGIISISRAKTAMPICFRVEPEAQEIIDKYKGQNYLLSFIEGGYTTNSYLDFVKKINASLKIILPGISSYWARHSWATFAAELDISDSTIDLALGHAVKDMASIYINRNMKKVSAANRKVIDYVLGKIEAPDYD